MQGHRHGADWLPGEVDVSIRPGWFYHASEDAAGPVARQFAEDLLRVGRPRGEPDFERSAGPSRADSRERREVAARVAARSWTPPSPRTWPKAPRPPPETSAATTPQFAAANAIDGKPDTYWATDDAVTTPELVLDVGEPVTFNVARVREYLPLGQRIDAIAVETWDGSRVAAVRRRHQRRQSAFAAGEERHHQQGAAAGDQGRRLPGDFRVRSVLEPENKSGQYSPYRPFTIEKLAFITTRSCRAHATFLWFFLIERPTPRLDGYRLERQFAFVCRPAATGPRS